MLRFWFWVRTSHHIGQRAGACDVIKRFIQNAARVKGSPLESSRVCLLLRGAALPSAVYISQ